VGRREQTVLAKELLHAVLAEIVEPGHERLPDRLDPVCLGDSDYQDVGGVPAHAVGGIGHIAAHRLVALGDGGHVLLAV
jgi:hypothetical protein